MLETYSVTSSYSFDESIAKLKESFLSTGFGTLCAISLNERFNAKNLTFEDQIMILEVCNPFEAHKALNIDPNIVYFLPCKVIVKASKDGVIASMIKPTAFITLIGHDDLNEFALNIEIALVKAMAVLN